MTSAVTRYINNPQYPPTQVDKLPKYPIIPHMATKTETLMEDFHKSVVFSLYTRYPELIKAGEEPWGTTEGWVLRHLATAVLLGPAPALRIAVDENTPFAKVMKIVNTIPGVRLVTTNNGQFKSIIVNYLKEDYPNTTVNVLHAGIVEYESNSLPLALIDARLNEQGNIGRYTSWLYFTKQ